MFRVMNADELKADVKIVYALCSDSEYEAVGREETAPQRIPAKQNSCLLPSNVSGVPYSKSCRTETFAIANSHRFPFISSHRILSCRRTTKGISRDAVSLDLYLHVYNNAAKVE